MTWGGCAESMYVGKRRRSFDIEMFWATLSATRAARDGYRALWLLDDFCNAHVERGKGLFAFRGDISVLIFIAGSGWSEVTPYKRAADQEMTHDAMTQ